MCSTPLENIPLLFSFNTQPNHDDIALLSYTPSRHLNGGFLIFDIQSHMRNYLPKGAEYEVPLSYSKLNQLLQPLPPGLPPMSKTARERCKWGRLQMHKLARCGIRNKALHALGISLIRMGDISFKKGRGHAIPFTTTNIAFMNKFHSWSQGVKLSSMKQVKNDTGTECQVYGSNRPRQQRKRNN